MKSKTGARSILSCLPWADEDTGGFTPWVLLIVWELSMSIISDFVLS